MLRCIPTPKRYGLCICASPVLELYNTYVLYPQMYKPNRLTDLYVVHEQEPGPVGLSVVEILSSKFEWRNGKGRTGRYLTAEEDIGGRNRLGAESKSSRFRAFSTVMSAESVYNRHLSSDVLLQLTDRFQRTSN